MPRQQSMYPIAVKARKNAKKPQEGGVIKRKKVVLNFAQREEIIKKGHSIAKLALDYGVGVRTVYDINKEGDAALSNVDNAHQLTQM